MIKIALDAMGGDFGPEVTVLGAMAAVKELSNVEITLYGKEEEILKYLTNNERIKVVHCESVIDMGETDPIRAIRKEKDSSLIKALESVKNNENQAIVSAGATQALVVGAHLIIRRMKNMHRVALAPIMPTLDKRGLILLDVGANVELRPEHLYELAVYATIVAKLYLKRENPKVGLLNIGSEKGKGREVDNEVYELLENSELINFIGNVEGVDIFTTEADIVVTDGFSGNLVLKTIEGTAKAMGEMLKEEIAASLGGKIGYLFMKKNLRNFKKRLSSSEVGGTLVYGLNSPVIKAHGSSDARAIYNAIRQAVLFTEANIIENVNKELEKIVQK